MQIPDPRIVNYGWGLRQRTLYHNIVCWAVKGVVHFWKTTFADNLLTPMSSKISMSFFLQSKN